MTLERTAVRSLYGSPAEPEQRRRWFRDGEVPVAVYGLGKMGLPLAAVYAETTGSVTGVDVDASVVDAVNQGRSPVENEPGLPRLVARSVAAGDLWATSEPAAAAGASSVHVVIVPTTLAEDRTADLSALRAALRDVGTGLAAGDIVVVESTVPPGTCRDLVVPLLEAESGLSQGEFGVAFCPERTASGRALEDIRSAYPKVVGGVDAESTATARLIYGEITENRVITVADATTAECVKLFEGVYRDVNIALANELARFADGLGVDTIAASEVANTQPYCDLHEPGAGVGGHCIPFYPYFLMEAVDAQAPLLATARTVSDSMPPFTASKLLEGLAGGGIDPHDATVAVLGVAYRAGVAETRASPALPIIDHLTAAGVTVLAVDPLLDEVPDLDVPLTPLADLEDRALDGAVLVTAHRQFDSIDWTAFRNLVVVDGRDALDLEDSGHAVYTVGRGA